MGSRYKFFREIWNDDTKHIQKEFPENSLVETFQFDDDKQYKIPLKYRYRPDLIAMHFYGDPKLFWVLVYANNFNNTPEDFDVEVAIRVPRAERIIDLI
jgi:hypothetical protein